jgi:hypothetical protein
LVITAVGGHGCEMLSNPIASSHHFPAARSFPLACAALPALDRPPISSAADRVRVFMRRAWVGKWCVRVASSGVGDCCRRRIWLLKYKTEVIYEYNPATAARQGGSVAASLVDLCEIGTADKCG